MEGREISGSNFTCPIRYFYGLTKNRFYPLIAGLHQLILRSRRASCTPPLCPILISLGACTQRVRKMVRPHRVHIGYDRLILLFRTGKKAYLPICNICSENLAMTVTYSD